MIVLTPAQMREADAIACAAAGEVALMRAAGECLAQAVRRYAGDARVCAFAGPGNNGGDAFAALAVMEGERRIYAQPATRLSAAREDAERRALASGVQVLPFPQSFEEALAALRGCDAVIVGLFGTGGRPALAEPYAHAVTAINESAVPAIAIDVPPGVDAEHGTIAQPALRPRVTVALGAAKSGLLLAEDRSCIGELIVADIGIAAETLQAQAHTYAALDDAEFRALLPQRPPQADKRSAGAPLIVAGSQQFPGAAVLCAMGAARAGAGYVTVATPQDAAPALRAHLIEQVVVTIAADGPPQQAADEIVDLSGRSNAIAMGPGLGLDERTGWIIRSVVQNAHVPIVADAGALFHFAKHLDLLRGKRIVLTPHEGEFARLSGKGSIKPGERVERLREFVERTGITTLLKGPQTLISDGTRMHINTTGTPALATAGTGDVLSGVIATLLAQGCSPMDAARLGAYWHGLAARHAAVRRPRGVLARDVYEALPYV